MVNDRCYCIGAECALKESQIRAFTRIYGLYLEGKTIRSGTIAETIEDSYYEREVFGK